MNNSQLLSLPQYKEIDAPIKQFMFDEELVKKTTEYYAKMENSLGGNLLMAKYDKMNEKNRQESRKK